MVIEQFPDGDAFADGLGLREPFLFLLGYGPLDFGERKSSLLRGAFVVKGCTANLPGHCPLFLAYGITDCCHNLPSKEEIL